MAVTTNRLSPEKILLALYDRIVAREITEFSQIVTQIAPLELDAQQRETILQKAFTVVKALSWGIFSDIHPRDYKALWSELVLPHADYRFGGNLKRNMTISSVYIAMLDIHGYTKFCRESKNNLSQLQELDDFVNTVIKDVAKSHGCAESRERGDEIILVGARADEILSATLEIIQIFARENFFRTTEGVWSDLSEKFNRALPVFNISAGISGGNSNSPMIITKTGELSGFLLNTAARLQARANKLAPRLTKIIIAKTVYTALKRDAQAQNLLKRIDFFDCGSVEFKGVRVANMEVLFREEQMTKLKLQKNFLKMLASLEQNLWKEQVLLDCLEMISAVVALMPAFSIDGTLGAHIPVQITGKVLTDKVKSVYSSFCHHDDYVTAIIEFGELACLLGQVPDFEPVVLEYVLEIHDRYAMLLTHYEPLIDREIEQKKAEILTQQELKLYDYFRAHKNTLAALSEKIRKSPVLTQRNILWNSVIESKKKELDFNLYSGKK